MKNKMTAAIISVALAGTMVLPAYAVEGVLLRQPDLGAEVLISVDETRTADSENLSRGELVSMLHMQAGSPVVNYAMYYTDVDSASEYGEAIRWATSEGLVEGYGDGRFGPQDPVTREQMAAVLYRYVQSQEQGFTGAWAFQLPYTDAEEISRYAYEGICWLTMEGLIGETESQLLAPKEFVTIAQGEKIFTAFAETLESLEIANPFIACETMAEAEEIAGFSLELPEQMPHWVDSVSIRGVPEKMIEVTLCGDEKEVVVRKGIGDGEISGDYQHYTENREIEQDGNLISLRGESGKIMVAAWNDGAYTYAIRAADGLTAEEIFSLVGAIK